MTSIRWAATPAALAVAWLLAACASQPQLQAPSAPREAASLGLAGPAATVDAQWWRGLGDAQLDDLVARALAGNPSLRVARARLERAVAQAGVAESARWPQVTGQLDATRQRFTATGPYPYPLGGSVRETGTLQLAGSWELDFFGKHESALQAALGAARAAQADAEAARVMLAASVVRAYLNLARLHGQLAVAERTVAQREALLQLVRQREQAGLDSRLELRQSETNVPDARAQVEALREQAQLARHALAALVGQPSADPAPNAPQLASLRPLPAPQALPVNLLGRRADIAAARWRVEAADRDIDSARAQFYPNINLMAFAGVSSIGLDRLTDSGSQQWGVGPAIRLPLFEGGRLRANLRGKAADREAAVAAYDAAVIDAVREVADLLASGQALERQRAQQAQAQQAAEAAYELAVQRHRAGVASQLQVLAAETTVLAQRRQGVDLAARALDTQAQLARALGGGWTASPSISSDSLAARTAQDRTQ